MKMRRLSIMKRKLICRSNLAEDATKNRDEEQSCPNLILEWPNDLLAVAAIIIGEFMLPK